jgi:hypothetical protein
MRLWNAHHISASAGQRFISLQGCSGDVRRNGPDVPAEAVGGDASAMLAQSIAFHLHG